MVRENFSQRATIVGGFFPYIPGTHDSVYGFGLFWLYAAFNDKYRNTAVLTTVIFAGGLVIGRLLSLLVDGKASTILLFYTALELGLIPISLLVYRLRD